MIIKVKTKNDHWLKKKHKKKSKTDHQSTETISAILTVIFLLNKKFKTLKVYHIFVMVYGFCFLKTHFYRLKIF